MDKAEYLAKAYARLEELTSRLDFQAWQAQVRARALQSELLQQQPDVGFTFDARRLNGYCDCLFSESTLLLREDYPDRTAPLGWVKLAAETFESLAKVTEPGRKEALLLNAALCYHIAGYQANAQCLAKLVEKQYLGQQDTQITDCSLDATLVRHFSLALVSFLRRDIPKLHQLTADSLLSIEGLQAPVIDGIKAGDLSVVEAFNLVAHAHFQYSLSAFCHYCRTGDASRFKVACKSSERSYENFQRVGDATLAVITSELRTVLTLFDERSTWSTISKFADRLLEDRVWRAYLRNLAQDSIVEFWPSQLKAFQQGHITSEDSFVVQMPTSAGKTLIAELSILAALTSRTGALCLYIAPYRALANEIQRAMARTLGAVGFRVSTLAGGFEFDPFQDLLVTQSDVLVATPEKADLLFRTHPEYFDSLSVVVIDEGHMLDEGIPSADDLAGASSLFEALKRGGTLGRGPLLELLITRLKHRCTSARFIFLSAVLPESSAPDLANWLTGSRQEALRIARGERPSRQLIAKFKWEGATNGSLEYISLPRLPDGRFPFVPHVLARQQYSTGERTQGTGRMSRTTWPDTSNKAQSVAMLASRFARTGPTLVFCAQPSDVRRVVRNLIQSLKYLEASDQLPADVLRYNGTPRMESFSLATRWLGDGHLLTQALHCQVGLHYGPLPDAVRQAVEGDFKNGKIRILVSTNTLGQGVNLPVKTVIVYSLERVRPNADGTQVHRQKVKKRDFWNICGRAGRAGMETEGQVVFVVCSDRDEYLLGDFSDEATLEELNSALFVLLKALVEKRISEDELVGYLDSHILAMLAEEVVDTTDEVAISTWLGTSLVGVQAQRVGVDVAPLAAAIRSASTWVVTQVPDAQLRRVFASTGLSVGSCKSLETAIDESLASVTEHCLEVTEELLSCDDRLLAGAFAACKDLPELRLGDTIKYSGPDDESRLVRGWISGKSIRALLEELWQPGCDDGFGEYLADRLVYKLPWGLNAFLRILAFKLQKKYEDLPLSWQHIPSMVRTGVNSVVACWASSLGISSRELASSLASNYNRRQDEGSPMLGQPSFNSFARWMANLPLEFAVHELAGFDEFEKQHLSNVVAQLSADNQALSFIRGKIDALESPVQGVQYGGRGVAAAAVNAGDALTLQPEPDNPYDTCAIRVLAGASHIGYVQRDKARIVSRELSMGRAAHAVARKVRPATASYPFPQIELAIWLEPQP